VRAYISCDVGDQDSFSWWDRNFSSNYTRLFDPGPPVWLQMYIGVNGRNLKLIIHLLLPSRFTSGGYLQQFRLHGMIRATRVSWIYQKYT